MSRLSSFYCCVLLVTLVHSSQSNNPFSKFGVFCKPVMGRLPVSKTGCESRSVRVKACVGTCASHTYPLNHPPYFKKFCKCCKPSATSWMTFNLLNCTSGISPSVQVESAVNCKCSVCTWKKKNKIEWKIKVNRVIDSHLLDDCWLEVAKSLDSYRINLIHGRTK